MELIKNKIIDQGVSARIDRYPLFVTPDDVYASPFLFSQEVVLEVKLDPTTNSERIEVSLATDDPLRHPLLVRYGCRAAIENYTAWWTKWQHYQEDCIYLGKKNEDIYLLLFMLEVALGRRFCEQNYMPA